MDTELSNSVDTRFLKSGKIRLRFKLSDYAFEIVNYAFDLTGCKFSNTSLDDISMNFLSGFPHKYYKLNYLVHGNTRFLVRVYPDQYESIRLALDIARESYKSDAEALVFMCLYFIIIEKNNPSNQGEEKMQYQY